VEAKERAPTLLVGRAALLRHAAGDGADEVLVAAYARVVELAAANLRTQAVDVAQAGFLWRDEHLAAAYGTGTPTAQSGMRAGLEPLPWATTVVARAAMEASRKVFMVIWQGVVAIER
jgi:hypothetical protein